MRGDGTEIDPWVRWDLNHVFSRPIVYIQVDTSACVDSSRVNRRMSSGSNGLDFCASLCSLKNEECHLRKIWDILTQGSAATGSGRRMILLCKKGKDQSACTSACPYLPCGQPLPYLSQRVEGTRACVYYNRPFSRGAEREEKRALSSSIQTIRLSNGSDRAKELYTTLYRHAHRHAIIATAGGSKRTSHGILFSPIH